MHKLELKKINKIYPNAVKDVHVIRDLDLQIDDGDFTVFVGPSGCGKSTVLRMIAGLEDITSGEILLDSQVVNNFSPSERGIGMVFQSYALYPHMTVRDNIAFGVKYTRKWPKAKVSDAVNEISDALEISKILDKKPHQLSGGQRQRVSIGRALIRQPSLFLLDEPLSNLDTSLRVRMRMQIADFHKQFNSTTIYVTHDQVEAMTLADKVVVLNGGNVEQSGTPLELYHYPSSLFIAKFIGSPQMNSMEVEVSELLDTQVKVVLDEFEILVDAYPDGLNIGDKLTLGIRPEDIKIGKVEDIPLFVFEKEMLGAESILYSNCSFSSDEVLVRCPGTLNVKRNDTVFVEFPSNACHLFGPDGMSIKRSIPPEVLIVSARQLMKINN